MAPAFTEQAPEAVAWQEIPFSYVVCTRDRATAVGGQRKLSARAQRTFEIDSGHSAFLARPRRVAAIITEIAGAPG